MVKFYNVSTGEITAQGEKPITVLKLNPKSFSRLATELGIGTPELERRLFSEERSVEYDKCICITTRTYKTLLATLALYSKYKYATLWNLEEYGWHAIIDKRRDS